jgi:hypothetical protein
VAASAPEVTVIVLRNHYAKHRTLGFNFHDTNHLRIGMGLLSVRIGEPMQHDKLLLVNCVHHDAANPARHCRQDYRYGPNAQIQHMEDPSHSLSYKNCMLYGLNSHIPERRLAPLIAHSSGPPMGQRIGRLV